MAEVTVPIDDKGMLSDIMADTPAETQAEPESQEQPRDEHGRFVAQQEETPVEQPKPETEQPAQQTEQDGPIPSWRLREMREERDAARKQAEQAAQDGLTLRQQMQALQRQLEQIQKPKPEPVDFFQNPDEAMNQRIAPVQSEIEAFKNDLRLEMSRELAVIKHGDALVTEVENAVAKAMAANHPDIPLLSAQMRASKNPVAVAIQWHQRNGLLEKTGGNLEAYVQKQLDEKLKDPAFLAKAVEAARTQAGTRPSTVVQIPPSLNKASGSGISKDDTDAGDMSDASLFRNAMGSPRR
jgi:hypothetical protein